MAEYISTLDGPAMDAALTDMNNHVSEAWAVGTRGGTPVTSGDETYHNNAKYYAESITTTLAPAYDSTSTYAVGDLVTYQGVVYECTTAITTPEAFNPSKWEVFNLEALKAEIQAQMNTKAPIITDTASGAIASFPDGADSIPVESLVSYINPLQDLHGQANPYPPGGGTNLLPDKKYQNGTRNVVLGVDTDTYVPFKAGTYTVSYTSSGGTSLGSLYLNISGESGTFLTSGLSATFTLDSDSNIRFTLYNGGDVSADAVLTWWVNSGDVALPYAPYSNECPVLGFTGVNIQDDGKNLIVKRTDTATVGTLTVSCDSNGVITLNGTANDYLNITVHGGSYISNLPATQLGYKCISDDASKLYLCRIRDVTDNTSTDVNAQNGKNFTPTQGHNYTFYAITKPNTTYTDFKIYPMLVIGGIADISSFVPYNGQVYNISWQSEAGTVYSGYIQYLGNGTWKLAGNSAIDNLGDITFTYNSNNQRMVGSLLHTAKSTGGARSVDGLLSSILTPDKNADVGDNYKMFYNSSVLYVYTTDYTDAAAFTAFVNGQTVMYPLATPIEYTLTGLPDPETLFGQNNIFNDTNGNIDVTYPCDTKLYIQKIVSA